MYGEIIVYYVNIVCVERKKSVALISFILSSRKSQVAWIHSKLCWKLLMKCHLVHLWCGLRDKCNFVKIEQTMRTNSLRTKTKWHCEFGVWFVCLWSFFLGGISVVCTERFNNALYSGIYYFVKLRITCVLLLIFFSLSSFLTLKHMESRMFPFSVDRYANATVRRDVKDFSIIKLRLFISIQYET